MVIAKSIVNLRDSGQQCGVNRVWRLMKRIGIKAQVGYRSPRARKGEASIVSPNRLQRQFNPDAPDERWVTDITYIRTHEGWLYLAVVVDLFSRKIIGWSMQSRMTKDIVLNALLMAVWRRNPQKQVLVHSDQGSQYTSHEWQVVSEITRPGGQDGAVAVTAMIMRLQKAFSSC